MPLVPVEKLRLPDDSTAIPRLRQRPFLVTEYAAAMRLYGGWGDFPPAVCDQDDLVLGGVTRVEGARVAGVTKAKVRYVNCEDDAQRLLVAAADNATNGDRWAAGEVARITLLADRMGLGRGQVAAALRVPVSRVERVPVTTVLRFGSGTRAYEERIYAKRAVRDSVRGRVLSEEEEEAMRAISTPHPASRLLRDLILMHQLDALPPLDPESHRDLVLARAILDEWEARDSGVLSAV